MSRCFRCGHDKGSEHHRRWCRLTMWRGEGYCLFCNEPLAPGHSCADTPQEGA